MDKYFMTSGLWDTDIYEFSSDEEAWNELRQCLPNKFVTLKKCCKIPCALVNPKNYIEHFNSLYAKRPIGFGVEDPIDDNVKEIVIEEYIAIYKGLSSDSFNSNMN